MIQEANEIPKIQEAPESYKIHRSPPKLYKQEQLPERRLTSHIVYELRRELQGAFGHPCWSGLFSDL